MDTTIVLVMQVGRISHLDALTLRRTVLRPEAVADADVAYPEDLIESTSTLAVRVDGRVVAIGTIMIDPHPEAPRPGDWRIRGMATDPAHRGRGYGRLILDGLIGHAAAQGARRVWCNARVAAGPFYESAGFVQRSDVFLTAGERPHFLMDLYLPGVS